MSDIYIFAAGFFLGAMCFLLVFHVVTKDKFAKDEHEDESV